MITMFFVFLDFCKGLLFVKVFWRKSYNSSIFIFLFLRIVYVFPRLDSRINWLWYKLLSSWSPVSNAIGSWSQMETSCDLIFTNKSFTKNFQFFSGFLFTFFSKHSAFRGMQLAYFGLFWLTSGIFLAKLETLYLITSKIHMK